MALLVIQSDKCVLLKRLRKLLIMDVDKDGFVTMIDLALLFGFWFGASLILILCYAVFDVCDRKGRRDDEKHRNEKAMLVEPTEEDSDSEVEGIVIENGDCVHYNANIPCSCPTPPPSIVRELA